MSYKHFIANTEHEVKLLKLITDATGYIEDYEPKIVRIRDNCVIPTEIYGSDYEDELEFISLIHSELLTIDDLNRLVLEIELGISQLW